LRPVSGTSSGPPPEARGPAEGVRSSVRLGPGRWLVIAGVLVAAFVVAQTCQKSQVRIDKDQAITRAEREITFEPTRKQVRLLRQGVGSKPFWVVSLSIPRRDGTFSSLAVIRINANTGKVEEVRVQR